MQPSLTAEGPVLSRFRDPPEVLYESRHLNDGSTGLVALLAHGFEDEAEAPARSLVEGRSFAEFLLLLLSIYVFEEVYGLESVRVLEKSDEKCKAASPGAVPSSLWQTVATAAPCCCAGGKPSA